MNPKARFNLLYVLIAISGVSLFTKVILAGDKPTVPSAKTGVMT